MSPGAELVCLRVMKLLYQCVQGVWKFLAHAHLIKATPISDCLELLSTALVDTSKSTAWPQAVPHPIWRVGLPLRTLPQAFCQRICLAKCVSSTTFMLGDSDHLQVRIWCACCRTVMDRLLFQIFYGMHVQTTFKLEVGACSDSYNNQIRCPYFPYILAVSLMLIVSQLPYFRIIRRVSLITAHSLISACSIVGLSTRY